MFKTMFFFSFSALAWITGKGGMELGEVDDSTDFQPGDLRDGFNGYGAHNRYIDNIEIACE